MTAHANGAFPNRVREAARKLYARGFRPIPVGYRTKKPVGDRWNEPTEGFDPDAAFPDHRPHNLGVLNGRPSGGFLDIDLDCPEARAAAPLLLPPTEMVWGRTSAPRSHYGYRAVNPPDRAAEDFDDPAGGHLLELRSTGGMTVVPPSMAPADPVHGKVEEPVVWVRDGDPAEIPAADLRAAAGAVAAAALLARHWPAGRRHDLSLAISGGLLRAGWAAERAGLFLRAVCAAAGDTEGDDRVRAVTDTADRLAEEKRTAGWPTAAKLLGANGETLVNQVREWLGVRPPKVPMTGVTTTGRPHRAAPKYAPLPPYTPFPVDALPPVLREFAAEVAAAMRVDPAFAALPALGAAAGMIGATRTVRLKRSWAEPAVLWAVVVGDSGTLKSPPHKLAVAPVLKIQADYFRQHRAAMDDYRRETREYEREKRRNRDADPGDPPAVPVCKRVATRDTTVEALAGILDGNRTRMLVARDEASGWLASFNQYKARGGSDMANWLELHSLGTLAVDRKTGEPRTVHIPGVGVSLCGGIQPGVLRKALSPEQVAAGVPARLLFAYPPRRAKRWTEADVNEQVERRYGDLIRALEKLEPRADEDGEPTPVVLSLTPDAKAEWVQFYDRFADRQADADGELAAAFSKLEGYAARLALVYHVCAEVACGGRADTPVPVEAVRAGIALATWFADEAERVYRMLAEQDEERELRQLVDHVRRLADRHGGGVTVKLLQRSNQRKYRTREAAEEVLEMLVGLGLGQWESGPAPARGGKSVRRFVPRVTCDDSYHRPDPDADGDPGPDETPRDDRPDPGDTSPGPLPADSALTTTPDSGCGDGPSTGGNRWYESSHVTHETGARWEPPAQPDDEESVVTPVADPVVTPAFTLVTDADGLGRVVAVLDDRGGPVGLDTETTGLDPRTARVRLIQLAVGPDTFLIDVFAFSDPATALAGLFEVLARVEVVGHHLGFDLQFLAPLGFTPSRVFDTMLASQLLYAGDRTDAGGRERHRLGDVAERELGRPLDKTLQKTDWSKPLTPAMLAYAAEDARVVLDIAEKLTPKITAARLTNTFETEMRSLPGVAWADPVTVDRNAWLTLADAAESETDRLRSEMDAMSPNPACLPGVEARNWNSPADVKAAFAGVGVKLESTDDDALAGVGHPLAEQVRSYRSAAKLAGSYGRKWLDAHAPGGTVLCRWNQLGAESGRMSAADPNLQQVPRGSDYRKCFVARPGMALVKADYSQIELRIAAKIADEKMMIDAYVRGDDLHALTAARLLGKPTDAVAKADRQLAKAINFGLLFGMGWRSLRGYARANYGVTLTDAQAQTYREVFFKTYPALRRWHAKVGGHVENLFEKDAARSHEVRTLGGRRRSLPVAKGSADRKYPNVTEALNTPVQGTGADGLKAAIALLWERRSDCPGAVPVLFCHDEIVVEAPADRSEETAEWLKACMVEGMAPLIAPVPVEVAVTVGPTWGG